MGTAKWTVFFTDMDAFRAGASQMALAVRVRQLAEEITHA
jgi:hypothetical protein